MDATDRKQLDIDHEVLMATLERWMAMLGRIETDNERTYLGHAIDGLSDSHFYAARVLEMTRGFYPAPAA
jgi:hypothetical protein